MGTFKHAQILIAGGGSGRAACEFSPDLLGECREQIRAAKILFTPCKPADSLLEAVSEAASSATSVDVVLLSPACSGLDLFRNHQPRGEAVWTGTESIPWGSKDVNPYIDGVIAQP
jgi:UDP-N-acetylmuramoylalanine--D-glutamate ligase